jgi:cellulose synthase/poly-beta-1,6-N-acetylglucosamine synthase-like glycosyltransferase
MTRPHKISSPNVYQQTHRTKLFVCAPSSTSFCVERATLHTMSWGIPDVLIDDEVRAAFPFLIPFGIIGLWRWTLFAIRVVCWLLYRPIHPRKKDPYENNATTTTSRSANRYQSDQDVTIIVPTIDNGEEFKVAAKYWKMNRPKEIIVVTSQKMELEMQRTCASIDSSLFRVLSVPQPNKRVQMVVGINAATTDIVALADDDAIWTEHFLEWCLAPFDDDKMGGVGSKQIMTPVDGSPTFWEVIADFRLTMRMIECSASTFVDGGMSCLSGRTAIYRREILADPNFQTEFVNETWWGKYALHSGDDKFITRWLVKNGWNMYLQNHKEACLQTTFSK